MSIALLRVCTATHGCTWPTHVLIIPVRIHMCVHTYTYIYIISIRAGEIHLIPESDITALRTHLEVVPFFRSSLRGAWDLRVFSAPDSASQVWCTQILFVQDVGASGVLVVACSTGSIGVVSVEGRQVLHYFHQHRLSVKALEWCSRQNNLMASAGLDRDIHLWRPVPFKHGKPIYTGSLTGHKARVVALAFHEARDVLFSLDSHSVILVWDLASRTLICRHYALGQNPFDITHKVVNILVNPVTRHLVTLTNHPRLWGIRSLDLRDESDRLVPHNAPAVACLYNASFDHLLTADEAGLVSLWHVTSGRQLFKFVCEDVEPTDTMPKVGRSWLFFGVFLSALVRLYHFYADVTCVCIRDPNACANSEQPFSFPQLELTCFMHSPYTYPQVTCAQFDQSQRRLMVGWSQGSLQVYNFSNGTLLNNLLGESTAGVTTLAHATYIKGRSEERSVLFAAYDDGLILQWPNKLPDRDMTPVRRFETPSWMGANLVDVRINALAFRAPSMLLEGRKDGLVMMWDLQTGFLIKTDKNTMSLQPNSCSGTGIVAVKFVHKQPHLCLAADEVGFVFVIDTVKLEVVGSIRCGISQEEEDAHLAETKLLDGLCVLEVDDTDSFIIIGDVRGFLKIVDISQVFSRSGFDGTMLIDLFFWRAHRDEITQMTHVARHNVIMTSSRENKLQAILWTVTGEKIGVLGHTRWTEGDLLGKQKAEEYHNQIDPLTSTTQEPSSTAASKTEPGSKLVRRDSEQLTRAPSNAAAATSSISGRKSQGRVEAPRQRAAVSEADAQGSSEDDDEPRSKRGQLSVSILQLMQLPSTDRVSKADPYCCLQLDGHPPRRTRTLENQVDAKFGESFLYFLTTLDVFLTIEVWDHDNGKDDDFIGQISGSVDALLRGERSVDLMLALTKKDGGGRGNLGYMDLRLEFEAITSELDRSKAKKGTLQDSIKQVLLARNNVLTASNVQHTVIQPAEIAINPSVKHDEEVFFVPLVPRGSSEEDGRDAKEVKEVTSLATARWSTCDFRNLAVYRLQDHVSITQQIVAAQTERSDRRTRKLESDVIVPQTARSVRVTGEHRYARDTHTGKLERSLDTFYAQAFSESHGHVGDSITPRARGIAATSLQHAGTRLSGPRIIIPRLRLTQLHGGKNVQVTQLQHVSRRQEEELRDAENKTRRLRKLAKLDNSAGTGGSAVSKDALSVHTGSLPTASMVGGIAVLRRHPSQYASDMSSPISISHRK
jgi:WD40 repeat protein